MKKNKKKTVVLVTFIVLCILFLSLIFFNKDADNVDNNKKLLLECSKDFNYNEYKQTVEIELYENDNNTYLIQKLIMEPNFEVSEELSESILARLKNKAEVEFKNNFQENKFIDYNVYKENRKYISEISYTINKENKTEMTNILEYDYFDNKIDSIILNIEKGGLKCLKR